LDDEDGEIYYDKAKSFFDNISCEASDRAKGVSSRTNWKEERKLNYETFGTRTTAIYSRGRGVGFSRGRGYGGGYRGARTSEDGYRGGQDGGMRGSRDNTGFRGRRGGDGYGSQNSRGGPSRRGVFSERGLNTESVA